MNTGNFSASPPPGPDPAVAGRLSAAAVVKAALGEAVRRVCDRRNLSRAQLCDWINEDLEPGEPRITLRALNHWLSGDPRYCPPASLLPLLTAKLGPDALRSLAELTNLRVVTPSDAEVIPLGRTARTLLAGALERRREEAA